MVQKVFNEKGWFCHFCYGLSKFAITHPNGSAMVTIRQTTVVNSYAWQACVKRLHHEEKLLVFTQFREMTSPLAEFLTQCFGQPGLVLHGGTTVKRRKQYVDAFQQETGPPFFVLSIKAGGTGLNLTQASHVIHFDRWWNPAVENQATDRAFRIGQQRNVMVHKMVCRGTIEEKIDRLISEKQSLAKDIMSTGTETLLTEMNNDALIDLVSLDVNQVDV